ncbi:MAG: neuromedin U [Terriglobales bacterium]
MRNMHGAWLLLAFLPLAAAAQQAGQAASTEALQKATQNPVASLISVPFQNNTSFNLPAFGRDQNVLNIQPVVPGQLSANWNLITRVIAPVIYQPALNQATLGTVGIGDLQPTFFLSPAKPGALIWGVGPAFQLPTATNGVLGSGKWQAGGAAVALLQPGPWTLGVLLTNLWSFAGQRRRPAVNAGLLQYFVNYNLAHGWFLTTAPVLTANWKAPSHSVWVVPVGGGIGRIFRIGAQPFNASVAYYANLVRPQASPTGTWQLRVQVALLFPRRPK